MGEELHGRVAVITGGASGIGRATALRLLAAGASVVIADLNEETAAETLELAARAGHDERLRFRRCDVANEAEVAALVGFAVSELGRLDCMFNNAGLPGAFGPLTETVLEDWERTFAVLVHGVFLGTKHAARAMLARGDGGAILNTASIAALSAGAGGPAYSACKAAVVNFTRSAAVELAPGRIRVNAICPGAILTPLVHRGHEAEVEESFARGQPWPEAGRPEHVAELALFLASERARFLTGEAIVLDGGLTALGPALYAGHNPAGNAIVAKISEALGVTVLDAAASIPRFDAGNTGEGHG